MVQGDPCAVCGSPSNFRCGGCKNQNYCSKEHQKSDWKAGHKQHCRPCALKHSDTFGRYLVATRDLPPGALLLREDPLVVVPKQWTRPLCLGCFRYVNANSSTCSICGWPMCSDVCARSPQHKAECQYTCRRKDQNSEGRDSWKISIKQFDHFHPMYYPVALLRALYLRDHNKEMWEKFISLESHSELRELRRKDTKPSAGDDEWVVQFTKKFFALNDKDLDDLRNIIGVIMVNGHEVPLPQWMCHEEPIPSFVAVYHMASMFEHNCVANCRKIFNASKEIEIRTTVPVVKGERLSISYTDPFWGTIDRKKHLFATKFFNCHCFRCEDPTELGTFLSGIKCSACPNGFCVPVRKLTSEDNKEDETLAGYYWECWGTAGKKPSKDTGCGRVLVFDEANQILQDLGSKLLDIKDDNINKTLDYLRVNSGAILHKNHQYLIGARIGLMRLLQSRPNTTRLSLKETPEIQLMERNCAEILEVANIVSPGMTEIRGILMYEVNARKTANILSLLKKGQQKISIDRETVDRFEEAVNILSIESERSDAAAMTKHGRMILGQLSELIQTQ